MDTDHRQWLIDAGFQLVGALARDADGVVICGPHDDCTGATAPLTRPSVYAYLIEPQGGGVGQIIYVGKASKGWEARRGQHNGGYKRAAQGFTSQKHRARIATLAQLLDDHPIHVFEKPALQSELHGHIVWLHDAEEQALRQIFRPMLNVAGNHD